MLEDLKCEVCEANIFLSNHGLAPLTWGNVSGRSADGLIIIKPSGVEYSKMRPSDMVVTDINGKKIEGDLSPSTDLFTHLEIYKAFSFVMGVAHTHSPWCVVFAQAGKSIPALGTTHADYFSDLIPCTENMKEDEVKENYEKNTGLVITRAFSQGSNDPKKTQAVLVKNHGPFTWGNSAYSAAENAFVLEEIAKMAYYTIALNPKAKAPKYLLKKHYERKRGPSAYYGQKK